MKPINENRSMVAFMQQQKIDLVRTITDDGVFYFKYESGVKIPISEIEYNNLFSNSVALMSWEVFNGIISDIQTKLSNITVNAQQLKLFDNHDYEISELKEKILNLESEIIRLKNK